MSAPSEWRPETVQHARDYWRADGIPLLVGSLLYLLVVSATLLIFALMDSSPPLPAWVKESAILLVGFGMVFGPFFLILIVSWLATNWEDIVEWFKVRLTYPRTGYVAPPSYWKDETDNVERANESRLKTILTLLGGFWFWCFVLWGVSTSFSLFDAKMSRPIRAVLLCILLSIRLATYALYPEPTSDSPPSSKLRMLARLLRSVLNSFWVWILMVGVLPPLPRAFHPWLTRGMLIVLTVFIAWAFTRKEPFLWGIGVCVCFTFATFVISSNEALRFAVAVLVPGIYAFTLGAIRLGRYLKANPVRTV